jgi:hypothetical protein
MGIAHADIPQKVNWTDAFKFIFIQNLALYRYMSFRIKINLKASVQLTFWGISAWAMPIVETPY